MKIIDIQYDEKKAWFWFILNSGQKLAISYDAYIQLHLHKDEAVSKEQYAALCEENQKNRAFSLALSYATYQKRTTEELRTRLRKEQIDEHFVEMAIQKLIEMSLLDDSQYILDYYQDKLQVRHWSLQQIRQKLWEKGISFPESAQLKERYTDEIEQSLILYWYEKKYQNKDLQQPRIFQNTYAALCRKGFRSSNVLKILKDKKSAHKMKAASRDEYR